MAGQALRSMSSSKDAYVSQRLRFSDSERMSVQTPCSLRQNEEQRGCKPSAQAVSVFSEDSAASGRCLFRGTVSQVWPFSQARTRSLQDEAVWYVLALRNAK